MFSNDSYRQADACRFCWMCRHVCPVGQSTGSEAWTPRARGLLISMIKRGKGYDADIADIMYKCSLCDACANDCVTGFQPSKFIREARTAAVAQQIAPEGVTQAIDNITSGTSIYGETNDPTIESAIKSLPEKADVLLFLGQVARTRSVSTALAAISLLKKAGVGFTVLKNEPCSGAYLVDLMGYTGDVQDAAEKTAELILASGAKTLVVLNPHDAVMFKEQYTQWCLLSGVKIITATAYFKELIEDGKIKPKHINLTATFHDPCMLTRGLSELEDARVILAAMGVDLKEMYLNRKMTKCCGGTVLDSYAPTVVKSMVHTRMEDAERIGTDKVITACPDCQSIMSRYAPEKSDVVDLLVLLDQNC